MTFTLDQLIQAIQDSTKKKTVAVHQIDYFRQGINLADETFEYIDPSKLIANLKQYM